MLLGFSLFSSIPLKIQIMYYSTNFLNTILIQILVQGTGTDKDIANTQVFISNQPFLSGFASGPSLYYVSKGTGWMGSENGNIC